MDFAFPSSPQAPNIIRSILRNIWTVPFCSEFGTEGNQAWPVCQQGAAWLVRQQVLVIRLFVSEAGKFNFAGVSKDDVVLCWTAGVKKKKGLAHMKTKMTG